MVGKEAIMMLHIALVLVFTFISPDDPPPPDLQMQHQMQQLDNALQDLNTFDLPTDAPHADPPGDPYDSE